MMFQRASFSWWVIVLMGAGVFLLISSVSSQDLDDEADIILTPDGYQAKAQEHLAIENYDAAISVLKEGQKQFPDAVELYKILGDLYFDKDLYSLALTEYENAEKVAPEDSYLLNQLATTHGHLTNDHESVKYFEKAHLLYPEDTATISDLGWMYFKTHRLEDGVRLMEKAIDDFGINASFAMTMATLQADLYEYETSRDFYLTSIDEAKKNKNDYFASVAYYNLSLLETTYYHFNLAFEYTGQSIGHADRATGHIARGELFEKRLEFRRAHTEYQTALALDQTPLAKVNTAILYRRMGLLDEAIAYTRKVLDDPDLSWMYFYGTTTFRFKQDLHKILYESYRGKAEEAVFRSGGGLWGWLVAMKEKLLFSIESWYHEMMFRNYSQQVAEEYLENHNLLNAYWTFYGANEKYRPVAAKYLQLAREFETAVIPRAIAYYQLEEAKQSHKPDLIFKALDGFDPYWERDAIEDAYRSLAEELNSPLEEYQRYQYLTETFLLNPGGLRQYGHKLPAKVTVKGAENADRNIRRILASLRSSGLIQGPEDLPHMRIQLNISSNDKITVTILDTAGDFIKQGTVNVAEKHDDREAGGAVANWIFSHHADELGLENIVR